MNYWFLVFVLGLILVSIFWFKDKLLSIGYKGWLIVFTSLIGGIFAGSFIIFGADSLNSILNINSVLYSSLWGPIIEEIIKFIVAYSIIKGISDYTKNPLWGLIVGIFVGLGFGLYENFIYLQGGVDDVATMIFRIFFVGGIILHPLSTGIAGYMTKLSMHLGSDRIFKEDKINFQGISGFWGLIKFIWGKASKPFKVLLNFFKRVLFLDVTVDHILLPKYKQTTTYGRAPSEIVIEGLFLAIWLHILYNTSLVYMQHSNIMLIGVMVFVLVLLRKLIHRLFDSYFLTIVCYIVMFFGYIPSVNQNKLLFINLILVMGILFLTALELRDNFNYS